MGLFRKESKTTFVRDSRGRVIQVSRDGRDITHEPRWKSSRQLEDEYYRKHPKESPSFKRNERFKKIDRAVFGPPPKKKSPSKKRHHPKKKKRKKRYEYDSSPFDSDWDPVDNWGML